MKKKIVWLVVTSLMVLALLAASCAPAPEKEVAPAKEAAPAVKKEVAPAAAEKAPAEEKEMVKVTLTKLDGTVMEKLVEKPKYGGVFTVARCAAVLGWDEGYQAPWTPTSLLTFTNEELLAGDWARGQEGTGELSWLVGGWFSLPHMKGSLAESWEHPDDETLIFHIRKGVHWALNPDSAASRLVGGRELTADDIAWNLKRIYFDMPTSTMYGMAGGARPTDVYAPDKYTVVVKAPPGSVGKTLEYVGDLTRIMAPEVGKKYGDYQKWENNVGTGPFMLVDYVPMSSTAFVRNPNYWEHDPILGKDYPLPYLQSVKVLQVPDLSTRLAALRTGRVDWDYRPFPLEDAESLIKTSPNLKYVMFPHSSYGGLIAGRQDKPELPFDDIRVRRALNMALDQQEIIDTLYRGKGNVLNYMVMPTIEWEGVYTPLEQFPPAPDGFDTRKLYGYYPEEAKKLLAEAGYPDGFKTEILLGVDQVDMASIIKDYWAKIGVDLKLDVKEAGVKESIYQRKAHTEMYYHGGSGHVPYELWWERPGNMWNMSMHSDPKIEDYYVKLNDLYFEPEKRRQLLKEANLYVISRVNYTYLPSFYQSQFWQPWVKRYHGEYDVGFYNMHCYIKYMWLDQELKKAMGY